MDAHKTKAALQGRLSHFSDIAENNSTLIDQVNARRFAHIFSGYGQPIVVTAAMAQPDFSRASLIRWFYSASSVLKRGVSTFGYTPQALINSLISSRNANGVTGFPVSLTSSSAFHFYPIGGNGRRPQNEVIGEIRDLPILVPEKSGGYSCEVSLAFLRWRRLISPSRAATTNCPMLSSTCLRLSTSAAIESGTLTSNLFDFALMDFVAIAELPVKWCPTMIIEKKIDARVDVSDTCKYSLSDTSEFPQVQKQRNPEVFAALTGSLTKPLSEVTNMAEQQHTQTHPKFTWRFLAIDRADMAAKPCLLSVVAETEKDARRVLAPHFILSLAARLPVVELRHA
ncbi:host cell division inhibitor Icd-like protein [Pantoea vagans]|uniref:host cell division inhibitor Icd-like protein n=1 Tax=Pantoea vagans TaxID=470934 RepID=UPI003FA38643